MLVSNWKKNSIELLKRINENINVIGDKFANYWSHDIIPKKNIFNRKVEFNLE